MSSTTLIVLILVMSASVLCRSPTNLTTVNDTATHLDRKSPEIEVQSMPQLLESERNELLKQMIEDNPSKEDTTTPEEVVGQDETTNCQGTNIDHFISGCLVSSMMAWNLQVKEVSMDAANHINISSLCKDNQSSTGCGLRYCCSIQLSLRCLLSAHQTCAEVLRPRVFFLDGLVSKICPENMADACLSGLSPKDRSLGSKSVGQSFAYEVESKEPLEMVRVAKESDDSERITVHLRFGSGSMPTIASAVTSMALLVIGFALN